MPTPLTLAQMFEMPKNKITFSGDVYAINKQLKLPPWSPLVVEVWKGQDPAWLSPDQRKATWKLRELLNELHAEHLKRKAANGSN